MEKEPSFTLPGERAEKDLQGEEERTDEHKDAGQRVERLTKEDIRFLRKLVQLFRTLKEPSPDLLDKLHRRIDESENSPSAENDENDN